MLNLSLTIRSEFSDFEKTILVVLASAKKNENNYVGCRSLQKMKK